MLIALAYFAIPVTMAIVLRNRRDDIPYPWLWMLFVIFIVACGMTHLVHIWSVVMGGEYLGLQATIAAITALASVGTAIAFAFVLPQISTSWSGCASSSRRWALSMSSCRSATISAPSSAARRRCPT
jgi:hypothetical protein